MFGDPGVTKDPANLPAPKLVQNYCRLNMRLNLNHGFCMLFPQLKAFGSPGTNKHWGGSGSFQGGFRSGAVGGISLALIFDVQDDECQQWIPFLGHGLCGAGLFLRGPNRGPYC